MSEKTKGLSQALAEIGDSNITFQTLESSAKGANMRKGGVTEFTFYTGEAGVNYLLGDHDKLCLIVWVPRDKFIKAATP